MSLAGASDVMLPRKVRPIDRTGHTKQTDVKQMPIEKHWEFLLKDVFPDETDDQKIIENSQTFIADPDAWAEACLYAGHTPTEVLDAQIKMQSKYGFHGSMRDFYRDRAQNIETIHRLEAEQAKQKAEQERKERLLLKFNCRDDQCDGVCLNMECNAPARLRELRENVEYPPLLPLDEAVEESICARKQNLSYIDIVNYTMSFITIAAGFLTIMYLLCFIRELSDLSLRVSLEITR